MAYDDSIKEIGAGSSKKGSEITGSMYAAESAKTMAPPPPPPQAPKEEGIQGIQTTDKIQLSDEAQEMTPQKVQGAPEGQKTEANEQKNLPKF